MPAVDLVALVRKLPAESALSRQEMGDVAGWGPHEENTARLLERIDYTLNLKWIDRTTDPEDPDVKRERAAAKRAGIKPPERPLVPPIALRPPSIADQMIDEYVTEAKKYQLPASEQPSGDVTFEQFWDAIADL